jgi:hypothetical protein
LKDKYAKYTLHCVFVCVNPKPNGQDRSSILTNFGNWQWVFLFYFLARPFVNIFCWTLVVGMVSGLHNRVKSTNNSHYEEVEGNEGATTCKGQSVFSHSMFAWLGVISQVNTATLLLACSSLFNDKFCHSPQQKVSPPVCKNGLMISAFLSLTPPWVGWLIYWHTMHKKLLEIHAHSLVILMFATCKPWRRIQFLVAKCLLSIWAQWSNYACDQEHIPTSVTYLYLHLQGWNDIFQVLILSLCLCFFVSSLGTSHANVVLQYFEISIFKVKQATVLELHFLHCCKLCNKPTLLQNFSGYT